MPLIALAIGLKAAAARPNARATIGYLVYKLTKKHQQSTRTYALWEEKSLFTAWLKSDWLEKYSWFVLRKIDVAHALGPARHVVCGAIVPRKTAETKLDIRCISLFVRE